jgi:hypothetical protein
MARTLLSPFSRLHVAALGAHVGQHVVQPAPFFIGELVGDEAAVIVERPRLVRRGACSRVMSGNSSRGEAGEGGGDRMGGFR